MKNYMKRKWPSMVIFALIALFLPLVVNYTIDSYIPLNYFYQYGQLYPENISMNQTTQQVNFTLKSAKSYSVNAIKEMHCINAETLQQKQVHSYGEPFTIHSEGEENLTVLFYPQNQEPCCCYWTIDMTITMPSGAKRKQLLQTEYFEVFE